MEPNIPRAQWPLGRVIECYPGRDGHVRAVKIWKNGHNYVRPIVKLCPFGALHAVDTLIMMQCRGGEWSEGIWMAYRCAAYQSARVSTR